MAACPRASSGAARSCSSTGSASTAARYGHVAERLAALGLEVLRLRPARARPFRGRARLDPRTPTRCSTTCASSSTTLDRRGARPATTPRRCCSATASAARSPRAGDHRRLGRRRARWSCRRRRSPCTSRGPGQAVLGARAAAIPDRALPNELPVDKLSHEPRRGRGLPQPTRSSTTGSRRGMYGFLADAGAAVVRDAARLTVPTLLLVAGDDGLVDARGSRALAAALAPGIGTAALLRRPLPRDLQRARARPHARARRSRRLDRAAAQPLSGATTVRSGQAGPRSTGARARTPRARSTRLDGPSTICRRQALASPSSAASSSAWNAS